MHCLVDVRRTVPHTRYAGKNRSQNMGIKELLINDINMGYINSLPDYYAKYRPAACFVLTLGSFCTMESIAAGADVAHKLHYCISKYLKIGL